LIIPNCEKWKKLISCASPSSQTTVEIYTPSCFTPFEKRAEHDISAVAYEMAKIPKSDQSQNTSRNYKSEK
jgi:hypothetical protein